MYNAKEQPAAKVKAAFSKINQMINTFLNTVTHTIILQQPPVNQTESAERTDRAPLHLLSWCPWKEKKKVIKRGGGQRQTFSLSHGCLAAHFSGESMYRDVPPAGFYFRKSILHLECRKVRGRKWFLRCLKNAMHLNIIIFKRVGTSSNCFTGMQFWKFGKIRIMHA